MAINLFCSDCKRTNKLGTTVCRCGNDLRKNRKFRARFKLPDGKWKSKVVDTLEMAQKVESKYRVESVEQDVFDKHRAPRIDEVWKKYIKWAEANKRSWKDDKARWELHIKEHVGSRRMNKIMPQDVEAVLNSMREAKNPKGNPYAPATVKQVLVLLRRVYNWSIKQKLYYGVNPASHVEMPRFDNQVTNPLSKDDVNRVVKYIDTWENERAALFIKFALYSGRRRGEILHLKWKDVSFETGMATFSGAHTKNAKSQTVPMNESCIAVLKRCHELKLGEYVFTSSTGAFYTTFENTWKRFKKRLKLDFRFHDLRHTYASYLASSGKVDIYVLKELLGHKTLKMTQRYAHLINGALQKGASVADEVFDI